uniref:Uncharacterized protein n=1 Tax=Arundo donax TaxID=35708 RepID=A0A0A9C8Y6_ARUDO
MSPWGWMR